MKFLLFSKQGCKACDVIKRVLSAVNTQMLVFTREDDPEVAFEFNVNVFPTLIWYTDREEGRMEGYSRQGLIKFMEGVEQRQCGSNS